MFVQPHPRQCAPTNPTHGPAAVSPRGGFMCPLDPIVLFLHSVGPPPPPPMLRLQVFYSLVAPGPEPVSCSLDEDRVWTGLTSWSLAARAQPSLTRRPEKAESSNFHTNRRHLWSERSGLNTKSDPRRVYRQTVRCSQSVLVLFVKLEQPDSRSVTGLLAVSHTQWKSCESTASAQGQNRKRT